MITYEYECECCQHTFEVRQSIKDKPLNKCPACNQYKLYRIIHGGTHASVKQDATTLGQQAERNAKKFGKTKVQELDANKPQNPMKQNERRQKINKILKRDKAGIEKYIWTGK